MIRNIAKWVLRNESAVKEQALTDRIDEAQLLLIRKRAECMELEEVLAYLHQKAGMKTARPKQPRIKEIT